MTRLSHNGKLYFQIRMRMRAQFSCFVCLEHVIFAYQRWHRQQQQIEYHNFCCNISELFYIFFVFSRSLSFVLPIPRSLVHFNFRFVCFLRIVSIRMTFHSFSLCRLIFFFLNFFFLFSFLSHSHSPFVSIFFFSGWTLLFIVMSHGVFSHFHCYDLHEYW